MISPIHRLIGEELREVLRINPHFLRNARAELASMGMTGRPAQRVAIGAFLHRRAKAKPDYYDRLVREVANLLDVEIVDCGQ